MEERFGPWRLERRLAAGALADVTAARRDGEDVEIALKRLHTHQARDPEVAMLFAVEAALTRDIPPHPRVVRGLDTGSVDGRPWLAMGLVRGIDLRRRLDAGQRPTSGSVAGLVIEAADAVAHLHAHGWIHGDVNPANLIVGRAGRVTLCDLGVARRVGEPGPVRGTHAYMAPEQVLGAPWQLTTDVFALGVLLWELVASERLFYRGPPYLTMAAVMEAKIPPLPDAELDAIAARALRRSASARTPSAAELAAELTELAARREWSLGA